MSNLIEQLFLRRLGIGVTALCLLLLPTTLYAQSNEPLQLVWSSPNAAQHLSAAWGDFDNDGDLDFAVSKFTGLVVYRNDGGRANGPPQNFTPVWQSVEQDAVDEVAWGDVDGDGWLDLATASAQLSGGVALGEANRVYRNEGRQLADDVWAFRLLWSSPEKEYSSSVAWGDVDRDGDLDLAIGNDGSPNRLYRNEGAGSDGSPTLRLVWSGSSAEVGSTSQVAWGDLNNDGWPDLAVGGGSPVSGKEPVRVYQNQQGQLPATATWSSTTQDTTYSVAWGDADGDGDLDLATGNGSANVLTGVTIGEPNRIYRNDNGVLTTTPVWNSPELDPTTHIAWADLDSDGAVDLLAANDGQSRLYHNDGPLNGIPRFTLQWSTPLPPRLTLTLFPGDANQDGMLDLLLVNGGNKGELLQLYRNEQVPLAAGTAWGFADNTRQAELAWGDSNGDGALDLAVTYQQGANHAVGLHRNQQGVISPLPVGTLPANAPIRAPTWGDLDGDTDLDLAVVVGKQNVQVYQNQAGVLSATPVWQSPPLVNIEAVAWGDYDGDSDLDLAVGATGLALYRNTQGNLSSNAVWTSAEQGRSYRLAWGDVDNDGDLDLATGNLENETDRDNPNRLYRNDGVNPLDQTPFFTLAWSAQEFDPTLNDNATSGLAWGDVDGDGDLDLATSEQKQPLRLYYNNNGQLETKALWKSTDQNDTLGLAWGDYDSDGDLDLVTANGGITVLGAAVGKANALYRNDGGQLSEQAIWRSADADSTWGIGWGDVDNDGDLDLAAANYGSANRLYTNRLYPHQVGVNQPPRLAIQRPGATAAAPGFTSAEVLTSPVITVHYTLFDIEGDSVARLFPEFSPNGGGQWFPATAAPGGDGLTNLSAAPQGTQHTFLWHAAADMTKSDNVVFRLRAQPGYRHSPIYWAAPATQSPPFRVAPPWYLRVVDEAGNPVAGAVIYANGQPITQTYAALTQTDRAGILVPLTPPLGQALVALQPVAEQPSPRAQHDGWAYRTYLTSLTWQEPGVAQPLIAGGQGEQRLVLRRKRPLILFNLLVSIEWDADDAYLQQLARALCSASHYLHDLTDGQMAFGQVALYEKGEQWENADLQVGAKRGIRPHAYIGGIIDRDTSHVIAVGRGWQRNTDDRGAWDAPDGFRTLVHEFGHYALWLYDEYLFLNFDDAGNLQGPGESNAICTSETIKSDLSQEATNASAMYWQYTSSELSARNAPGLWSATCESTLQTQHNPSFRPRPQPGEGESTWATLARVFGDTATPPRWQIETPTERATVWPGPDRLGAYLPAWPTIHRFASPNAALPLTLTVYGPAGLYGQGALVTLYQSVASGGKVLGQGLTDGQGYLPIVGAQRGDTLRAVSLDGRYYGEVALLSDQPTVTMRLENNLARQEVVETTLPYVRILPEMNGAAQLGLQFQLYHFNTQSKPLLALLTPGNANVNSPAVSYSPDDGFYRATVALTAAQAGSGQVTVFGQNNAAHVVYRNTSYRLHLANNGQIEAFFADDGNVQIYLPAGSAPGEQTAFVINELGVSPAPLPAGLTPAGEVYEITASGSISALTRPGVLSLHYDSTLVGTTVPPAGLAIYRWERATGQWERQTGSHDPVRQTVSISLRTLGAYVLLAESKQPVAQQLYLPLVRR